jgi:ribosomal protein L29
MEKQKSSTKLSKEVNKEVKQKKPLTKEEILTQYRSALAVMQMKSKMGQLVKTHQIRALKKEIARVLTKTKN